MASVPIYLAISRCASTQRAHFAVFVPNEADAEKDPNDEKAECTGTLIHIIGNSMTGFTHELQHDLNHSQSQTSRTMVKLGTFDVADVVEPTSEGLNTDSIARQILDSVALHLPPPRKSEDFRAPLDDVKNRRSQEWTMDYLQRLVDKGYLQEQALEIAQSEKDAPSHGTALHAVVQRAA